MSHLTWELVRPINGLNGEPLVISGILSNDQTESRARFHFGLEEQALPLQQERGSFIERVAKLSVRKILNNEFARSPK